MYAATACETSPAWQYVTVGTPAFTLAIMRGITTSSLVSYDESLV